MTQPEFVGFENSTGIADLNHPGLSIEYDHPMSYVGRMGLKFWAHFLKKKYCKHSFANVAPFFAVLDSSHETGPIPMISDLKNINFRLTYIYFNENKI